jgi:hypothetical protein
MAISIDIAGFFLWEGRVLVLVRRLDELRKLVGSPARGLPVLRWMFSAPWQVLVAS